MRISEMARSSSCSSQNLLTLAIVAGMETGYTASSGRRKARVLLRMPLTRHEALFLGPGTFGRGGGGGLEVGPRDYVEERVSWGSGELLGDPLETGDGVLD